MKNGLFIMIDGIAGSGKTTVIEAMYKHLKNRGLSCWNQQDWTETTPPAHKDVAMFDVLFTLEPTKQWVGSALRHAMFHDKSYSGISHAHAFALDREIQYRRLILPALEAGKIIIQDRGVSASLVYQPLLPNSLSAIEVTQLPGNKLALEHTPDHFVFTDISPERVAERIAARTDDAKGIYAEIDYLRLVDQKFREPWFREQFESRGTQFHMLPTGGTLLESQTSATELITQLLKS